MKKLFIILLPLIWGFAISLITKPHMNTYNGFVPSFVFPIVWSIIYLLMGLSIYQNKDNDYLKTVFKVNLIFNYAWTFIYFLFNMKIIAYIWIIILIIITVYMIILFYKENKLSAYLLIPYIIWLLFASVLNLIEILPK